MRKCVWFIAVLLLASPWVAAEPKYGGELVIAFGTDPEALDYVKMSSAPAAMVFTHVVETLFWEPPEFAPRLATGYEVSEDGLTWTIYLRKGVKFHDGTPFNAEAVKINLDRFREKALFAFLLKPIKEVEVVDEYTIRIYTEKPFAPLLAHLSHDFVGMISPKQIAALGEGEIIQAPIGTGPFKFDKWVRGEYIRLVKNPDYWGEPAYLDSIVFKVVPEDATRVVLLETGEVHAIMRVPPIDAPRLEATPGIELVRVPSVRTIYIGMNCQLPPFDDVRVRWAINYAVDKEAIVEHVLEGVGRPSDAPISPGIFGYHPMPRYEYNPERAKRLLALAGYPDGFKVTLYHPTGRYLMDAAIAEAVQSYLREVGIEVELVTMEWPAYLAFTRKPLEETGLEMYLLGWGCVTMDADYGLYPLFHSSQWAPKVNRTFYRNTTVDLLLEEARLTMDAERRDELYYEAIYHIWYDAPWLFLHSEVQVNAQLTKVKGLVHHVQEKILAHRAWLED